MFEKHPTVSDARFSLSDTSLLDTFWSKSRAIERINLSLLL